MPSNRLAENPPGGGPWRPISGEHLSPPDTRLGSGFWPISEAEAAVRGAGLFRGDMCNLR
jgi:hypothetical protein